MPRVPEQSSQVKARANDVSVMKVGTLSNAIVGNDVMEAGQRLTQNIAKAGSVFGELYAIQEKQEKKKKVFTAGMGAQAELDQALNSPDIGDDNLPKGLMNRKLGQTKDLTVNFDSKVNEIRDKYLAELDDDDEKQDFMSAFSTHALSSRDNVAKHQVKERNADQENARSSFIEMRIGRAATVPSDEALLAEINGAYKDNSDALALQGKDVTSIAIENQKIADKMIETNIYTKLETDPSSAKATLEILKDKVSPQFYQKTLKEIDGKRFENTRSDLYNSVFKSMKLSDGEPDIARMNKAIDSSTAWNPAQKEQLRSYMSSRAMEDLQNKNRQDKDIINQFSNEIIKGKQQGLTLDDALKSVGKYGGDAVDMKDREDIARKLYTDPGAKSDPETVLSLFEKNQTGKASKSEIRQAFNDGKINASDYVNISKAHISAKLGEAKSEETLAWTGVKNLATEHFGSSKKDEMNAYLYAVKIESQGKSAEETSVIAKRLLDSTVTSKGWLWDTKETNYETTLKQQDAKNEVWGSLKLDVGNDEIKAIGSGIVRKGASSWGASDIENFAKPFGGIEAIKKGTPVNNAINSLNKNGQLVTTENVKAVLAIYKDGNY